MDTIYQQRLLQILKTNSIQRGQFVLASGKTSEYYIDCRKTTLNGEGLRLITDWLLPELQALNVDAVGGMTLGADPIVSAAIQASAWAGRHPIDGFLVRKAAKGHGMGNQIEGNIAPYMRIALVEDVVTTGSSTVQAYQAIRAVYPTIEVAGIFAVVDRQAGGADVFKRMGLRYDYLFPVADLLS